MLGKAPHADALLPGMLKAAATMLPSLERRLAWH